MNFESNQLSIEQQFTHQVFVAKIKNLSYEEIQDLLTKFHKQMLFKENFYQDLFRQQKQELSTKQSITIDR